MDHQASGRRQYYDRYRFLDQGTPLPDVRCKVMENEEEVGTDFPCPCKYFFIRGNLSNRSPSRERIGQVKSSHGSGSKVAINSKTPCGDISPLGYSCPNDPRV